MTDNVVKFEQRSRIRIEPIVDDVQGGIEKSLKLLLPSIEAYERNASLEDVVGDILDGGSLLWHVYIEDTLAAAFTTCVLRHPQRQTLFIEFMGGVDMKVWMNAALNVLREV